MRSLPRIICRPGRKPASTVSQASLRMTCARPMNNPPRKPPRTPPIRPLRSLLKDRSTSPSLTPMPMPMPVPINVQPTTRPRKSTKRLENLVAMRSNPPNMQEPTTLPSKPPSKPPAKPRSKRLSNISRRGFVNPEAQQIPPPMGMATNVAMRIATQTLPIQLCKITSEKSHPKNAAQPPIRLLQIIKRINDINGLLAESQTRVRLYVNLRQGESRYKTFAVRYDSNCAVQTFHNWNRIPREYDGTYEAPPAITVHPGRRRRHRTGSRCQGLGRV